ncbi:MAG: hypothetical protein HC781_13955 [Leptolyngbyaceae cyanobacterium CSU_1_4]|nr:hypothetical protein [Leptolyngbyaceae cyanobacterium CSU_1_4]
MRSLRIIGIFLSTVAVFLALNWFFNTLMPLNQLNSLQPSRATVLTEDTLSSDALLECHMSQNWTTSSPTLLLNCNGSEVEVQQTPQNIKNLSAKIVAPGQKRAIAVSDPIVMIGKMAAGRNSNLIEADLLAYGNRSSNLSALQTSGVLQIISAEVTGLLGILMLFIDWRLSRARHARRASEVLHPEKAYAASGKKIVEKPPYQHKY